MEMNAFKRSTDMKSNAANFNDQWQSPKASFEKVKL